MSQSDYAIRVEGLGKRYRLGLQENATGGMYRYKSLRDSLGSIVKHPLQTVRNAVIQDPMDEENSFWALKDINFEVKRGEVVGIIGRNGAGKSTLLKILSQITKPTTGRADLYGRVGSLLEVGTGFHPELSGRENIYLNGAILGMTKDEVKAKFGEIIAFSEIEKFLDMAVKQYSSGMYMRLAFAVAAHLEPEILVVDEVLAVGDVEFQNKCLGKMKDVASAGRTVLFVSHNMDSVLRLCNRAMYLNKGRVKSIGSPISILREYVGNNGIQQSNVDLSSRRRADYLARRATITTITSIFSTHAWVYPFGESIEIVATVHIRSTVNTLYLFLAIFSQVGFEIASTSNRNVTQLTSMSPGQYNINCKLPHLRLTPGTYSVNLGLKSDRGDEDFVSDAVSIEITVSEMSAKFGVDGIRAACVPEATFQLMETI